LGRTPLKTAIYQLEENPMRRLSVVAIAATIALAGTSAAWAAPDAAKGKRVFNKCKACHSLKAGKRKIGPSLFGIMGRKAGTAKKFRYSKALMKSGLTWTDENLDKYITKPRKFVKGTKMSFPGLKKKADRDNLIAFLKQATR
jgi:cytochrome c